MKTYRRGGLSVGEAETDDTPEGLNPVFPSDFFAFFVGAAGVRDGDFVDAPVPFCDFGGDFRLEAETIGFELNTLEDFAAKDFVASLHVGEFEIGEDVGKQGKHFIGDVMPKIVDTLRSAEEAGAKDNVGTTVNDGFEEFAVVTRIVFEVGVLDEDNIACDFREATAESGAFTLVVGLEKDAEIAEVNGIGAIECGSLSSARGLELRELFEDLASAVSGAVIDEDDFLAEGSFDDTAKDFVNSGFFVVNGNDDGKLGINQSGRVATVRGHMREKSLAVERRGVKQRERGRRSQ
jgi:hypothetical protein